MTNSHRDASHKSAHLEVMVSAALDGHDLTAFEPLDQPGRGYQARCWRCGKTAWVGENGLIYSLLDGECFQE